MAMANLQAMERIADALPDEQREAYLRVVARLREVPEDDEYLLVLEAIGFTSLILREIPQQVRDVLSAADGVGGAGSTEYLLRQIREELERVIQFPSYRDHKSQMEELTQARAGLCEDIRALTRNLESATPERGSGKSWIFGFVVGVVATVVVYLCLESSFHFGSVEPLNARNGFPARLLCDGDASAAARLFGKAEVRTSYS